MRRLALFVAACTAAAGFGVPAGARTRRCVADETHKTANTNLTPKTQDIPAFHGLKGHYALPKSKHPTTLVVMFHGHNNSSDSWVCHLLDAANNHGVVAVAMDYRGTGWTGPDGKTPPSKNWGWFVKEGAADSVFAANYFLKRFPSIKRVVNFSVSMGANTGGIAQAAKAKRPDGKTPLFDYWFDIEGVTNLIEEYSVIRAVAAAGNQSAIQAEQEIDKECHGSLDQNPSCYRDITVVARTQDVASSGVKGAVVLHDVDDGLVPTNQSDEMTTALRAAGIPTDYYKVLRRNDWQNPKTSSTQGGTTLSGSVGDPLFLAMGQTYPQPLSGHGWEGSNTHIVMASALRLLWSLLEKGTLPANRQGFVDSDAGTIRLT